MSEFIMTQHNSFVSKKLLVRKQEAPVNVVWIGLKKIKKKRINATKWPNSIVKLEEDFFSIPQKRKLSE